jgi:serine/threonine protein phosphatase 1
VADGGEDGVGGDVLDRLASRRQTHETVFFKGNHETCVSEFLQNPAMLRDWRQYGGPETLMSYGLKPSINADATEQKELAQALNDVLPKGHREFLGSLRSPFSCDDFLSMPV